MAPEQAPMVTADTAVARANPGFQLRPTTSHLQVAAPGLHRHGRDLHLVPDAAQRRHAPESGGFQQPLRCIGHLTSYRSASWKRCAAATASPARDVSPTAIRCPASRSASPASGCTAGRAPRLIGHHPRRDQPPAGLIPTPLSLGYETYDMCLAVSPRPAASHMTCRKGAPAISPVSSRLPRSGASR